MSAGADQVAPPSADAYAYVRLPGDSLKQRNEWITSVGVRAFMNQNLQQFLSGKHFQIAGRNQNPRLEQANHGRERA